MDEDTKRYRITGSVFLLAILVIVLPMLFDGDGLPPIEIEPIPEISPSIVQEIVPVAAPQTENPYVEKVAALEAEVDEDLFSTEHGTLAGEPVLTKPDGDTRVWAVQVGSFASEDRALSLRQELRDAGYDAFVSSVKTDDKVMVRVGVGPYLDGAEAERVRRQLALKQAPDARVMAFST